jgi:hypothetical protein
MFYVGSSTGHAKHCTCPLLAGVLKILIASQPVAGVPATHWMWSIVSSILLAGFFLSGLSNSAEGLA